ncbi:hypothetical protein [Tsuneonella sp. HG222]
MNERLAREIGSESSRIDPTATVEHGVILDDSQGPIVIGARTRICAGAILRGPLMIGDGCLVGNLCMVRGPTLIGHNVRIGYAVEIKQAVIADRVMIGPQCFVADSRVDEDVYLGAQVRTSNQRLDRQAITVRDGERVVVTDSDKLGCWIGARAALGIQVIVLPGRVIAQDTVFEPRVTVTRNLPTGRYRVRQAIELVH